MTADGPPDLAMFPGQGSQRVGMAAHLLHDHPEAREVFALADSVLGRPLSAVCTVGSAEELERTENAQPSITATALAVWEVLRAVGYRPAAVAGHSLGEFPALVAAGVLGAESALRLVALRGRLMANVARRVPGTMAAVLGLPGEAVAAACDAAREAGVVEVANLNEPLQTVVSGESAAVAAAGRAALAAGAERVVLLKVSAPFHCSLMSGMAGEFAAELARHPFSDPELPLISSVTGDLVRTGAEARDLLRRQLTEPVRWVDVLRLADRRGIAAFTEIGPGRVLGGLVRRTLPDPLVRSTGDARRLAALGGGRPLTNQL